MTVRYITENPVAAAIAANERRRLEEEILANKIAEQEFDFAYKQRSMPYDVRKLEADAGASESKLRVAEGTERSDIDYATARSRNEGLRSDGIVSDNRKSAAEADYSQGSLQARLTMAENQAIGSGYQAQTAGYQAQSAGVKAGVDRATAGSDIARAQAEAHLKALDLAAAGNVDGAISVLRQNGLEITPNVVRGMQNQEALARASAALDAYRKISNDPVWLHENVTRFMGGDVEQTGMAPSAPPPVSAPAGGKTDQELWLAAMDDAAKALTANGAVPSQQDIIAYARTLYSASKNPPRPEMPRDDRAPSAAAPVASQPQAAPQTPTALQGRQLQWSPTKRQFRDKATGMIFDEQGMPIQ